MASKDSQLPRVMKIIHDGVEMTITPSTIEAVWREWERDNPGKKAVVSMSPKEFADRMLQKLRSSARQMQAGNG
jgi:hypothetical protein